MLRQIDECEVCAPIEVICRPWVILFVTYKTHLPISLNFSQTKWNSLSSQKCFFVDAEDFSATWTQCFLLQEYMMVTLKSLFQMKKYRC